MSAPSPGGGEEEEMQPMGGGPPQPGSPPAAAAGRGSIASRAPPGEQLPSRRDGSASPAASTTRPLDAPSDRGRAHSPGMSPGRRPLPDESDAGEYVDTPESVEEDAKCDCCRWLARVAREVAFTPFFRGYVCLLLYCHMVFLIAFGYHYMLAATHRMVSPPEDQRFLVTLAFLSLFLALLHLASTCVFLNARLAVSWMGMTRNSANVFFLPNTYGTPKKAMRLRDLQLLALEVVLLVFPVVFAAVATAVNGGSVSAFVGYFSWAGWVAFCVVFVFIYLVFLWRSLCAKAKANRRGKEKVKDMKRIDAAEPRGRGRGGSDDAYSDRGSRRDDRDDRSSRRWRRDDDDRESRSRRHSGRRYDHDDEEDPDAPHTTEGEGTLAHLAHVIWHRRRLANPEVMAEYGMDLFSVQAYAVHIVLGVVWVLVSLIPVGVSTENIEWVIIIIVIAGGSFIMVCLGVSRTKSRRIAQRQRRTSYIMLCMFIIFNVSGLIACFVTVPEASGILIATLILTQGLFCRRHDLHARAKGEAGAWFLPASRSISHEEERRRDLGNPSKWIPLIPCGSVLRTCFSRGACMEAEQHDPYADAKLHARLDAQFAALGIDKAAQAALQPRDGQYDYVVRPAAQPGFKPHGAPSAFFTNGKGVEKLVREERLNSRERVLQADVMVTTWYLVFFILAMGVAYGFGRWMHPDEQILVSLSDQAAPFAGAAPLPACGMRWGGEGAPLTLQDFAMLCYLSDGEYFERAAGLQEWFADFGRNVTEAPVWPQQKHGVPVGYLTYEMSEGGTAGRNASVFVLREPAFGSAWVRDLDAWGDCLFYQLLASLNPLYSLWPDAYRRSFIKFMGSVKEAMHGTDTALQNVELAVQLRLAQGATVFVVGHGTHGGWAKVLAHRLGGAVSAVSFASPGTEWTGEKFGATSVYGIPEVSVVPRQGVLTGIDRQTGFVQDTECDSTSMTQCSSMKNMLCTILQSCGDPHGRTFPGFIAGTVGQCDF